MKSITHGDIISNILVGLVMALISLVWGQPQSHTFNHTVKSPTIANPAVTAPDTDYIFVNRYDDEDPYLEILEL